MSIKICKKTHIFLNFLYPKRTDSHASSRQFVGEGKVSELLYL